MLLHASLVQKVEANYLYRYKKCEKENTSLVQTNAQDCREAAPTWEHVRGKEETRNRAALPRVDLAATYSLSSADAATAASIPHNEAQVSAYDEAVRTRWSGTTRNPNAEKRARRKRKLAPSYLAEGSRQLRPSPLLRWPPQLSNGRFPASAPQCGAAILRRESWPQHVFKGYDSGYINLELDDCHDR
jgi:hypothetical protein